ncbi:MAG: chorismate synthase [Pseudomonadota bacterium]|nr:chorismate synthase [Pseudomonadota bacterium]
MTDNQFGTLFGFTSFGESHGKAIGCVVDGVPPNLAVTEADIQPYLDRRKPGQNRFVTQRREADEVEILSGTFEGRTTGTPICLLIKNTDQRSKDYGEIAYQFRPGHADYTYLQKYGVRDYRGGGRSSARETAVRVAVGAIADIALKSILGDEYGIYASVVQIGTHQIDPANFNRTQIDQNPFFCGDAKAAKSWESYLDKIRKAGSSTGAIIEIVANGIPAGLGQPLYGKLDAEIAAAMMSINAVKGVEIGGGFALSALDGAQAGDEMRMADGKVEFSSNHAGGILGGISSGQPVTARIAIKPTSSILTPRKSVDEAGNNVDVITKGRHDPCVGIRAVPVAEAMMACVLLDQLMRHHAQTGLLSSE